jgi:phosphatidate cytidylyltransferase
MDTRIVIFVVALFALVAGLLLLLPVVKRKKNDIGALWRLYFVQILIVGFILFPAYLGAAAELLALLALTARAQYEFIRLHGGAKLAPRMLAAQAAGIGAVAAAYLAGPGAAAGLIATATALLLGHGLLSGKKTAAEASATIAAASVLLPATLIAHLALLARLEDGFAWLALVYILVETSDSFAYLFGKIFGRHKILPRLSPGKTAEGLLAGVVAAFLVGLLLNRYVYELPLVAMLGAIAVIIGGGILGDLLTSAVKRRQGQKDFAAVLRAHGGVLDIYDSLLLAAPLFHAYHRWALG